MSKQEKSLRTDKCKTLKLADYGKDLRRLMWVKMLHTATPEVRRLLICYTRLDKVVTAILPDRAEAVRSDHWALVDQINQAEDLMTGRTEETRRDVNSAWTELEAIETL